MIPTWKTGYPRSNQGPNRNINDDENGLSAFLESLGLYPPAELITTIDNAVGGGGYLTRQDLIDYSMLDASDNVLVPVLGGMWKVNASVNMAGGIEVPWDATDMPAPYTALVQPKFHITNPATTDIICDEAGVYQITVNDVWVPQGGAISPYQQLYETLTVNGSTIAMVSEVDWLLGNNGCSFTAIRRLAVNDVISVGAWNASAVHCGNGETTILLYKIAN